MLSFFSKKKQNSETPAEKIIQGPADPQQNNGDDFIFIEKKPTDEPAAQGSSMYPPYGVLPGTRFSPAVSTTNVPVPYVQGVPFEMAPQLCTKNAFEVTQLQVDGILALMTRQMSVEDEYNFTLERSIQNECY